MLLTFSYIRLLLLYFVIFQLFTQLGSSRVVFFDISYINIDTMSLFQFLIDTWFTLLSLTISTLRFSFLNPFFQRLQDILNENDMSLVILKLLLWFYSFFIRVTNDPNYTNLLSADPILLVYLSSSINQ